MKKSFNLTDYVVATCDVNGKLMTLSLMLIIFVLLPSGFIVAQTAVSLQTASINNDHQQENRLAQLAIGVHSSVYLTNGEFSQYGTDVPRVVYCDAASVDMLYHDKSDYLLVELIRIRLDNPGDDRLIIDLEKAQSFSNLKFILFEFGFDLCGGKTDGCLEQVINRMVKFSETPVAVVYNLSIPE